VGADPRWYAPDPLIGDHAGEYKLVFPVRWGYRGSAGWGAGQTHNASGTPVVGGISTILPLRCVSRQYITAVSPFRTTHCSLVFFATPGSRRGSLDTVKSRGASFGGIATVMDEVEASDSKRRAPRLRRRHVNHPFDGEGVTERSPSNAGHAKWDMAGTV
jgi:hypothetical protein